MATQGNGWPGMPGYIFAWTGRHFAVTEVIGWNMACRKWEACELANLEAYMLPSRLKVKAAFLVRVRLGPLMEFKFFLIGKKMRAFDVHIPVCDTDNIVIHPFPRVSQRTCISM